MELKIFSLLLEMLMILQKNDMEEVHFLVDLNAKCTS